MTKKNAYSHTINNEISETIINQARAPTLVYNLYYK